MDTIRLFSAGEFAVDGESFGGLAAVYYDGTPNTEYEVYNDGTNRIVERMSKGMFAKALANPKGVACYYSHDKLVPLGDVESGTLTLRDSPRGLTYRCSYDPTDPDHQRVVSKIKRGLVTGSSFGITHFEDKVQRSKEGKTLVRTYTGGSLFDVGPTYNPAFVATKGTLVMRSAMSEAEALKLIETERLLERLAEINAK